MNSTLIALISIVCIFGGALLGLWLQRLVPKHHLSKESQDVVRLGAGIIATLTALVLGLLVSSAKSTFDNVNKGNKQAGAKLILLDRVLAQYGPDTRSIREEIRDAVAARVEDGSINRRGSRSGPDFLAAGVEILQRALRGLVPKDDAQTKLLGEAQKLVADLSETRWLLVEEAQNQLPTPFLIMLLFWLTVLFASFGLFAPRNATVLTVLFVCAISVSGAIFLVLEMNEPGAGVIKVSNAPLLKALDLMGK
jgi:hypothetical protein